MVWLEPVIDGRFSRLYVRPIEPVDSALSIRKVAQLIELSTGPFLTAATSTLTEGAEGVPLSIVLPPAHIGLRIELELTVAGTALAGSDYTLGVVDPAQGIVLGGEANSIITLAVESAPAEPLGLLLQIRPDDALIQGDRSLNLRLSSYQAIPEGAEIVGLPLALNLIIGDDEPPTVQQVLVERNNAFACVLLVGGSLRCGGDNTDNRATPPDNLGGVAQFGVGMTHSCALTVSGRVRCWGSDDGDRATPPADTLGPFVRLAVGVEHSCALTVSGRVYCWGLGANGTGDGRATPPNDLGPVAQIDVGDMHSCALTVSGRVRCWGSDADGRAMPPNDLGPDGALGPVAQIGMGNSHGCALTVSGDLRCWGSDGNSRVTGRPADDVGRFIQLVVGDFHSCALTNSGAVYCWGHNGSDRITPPAGLGPDGDLGRVEQLLGGREQTCALTILGQTRCWGVLADISSLPSGSVETFEHGSGCALLVDGSAYCGSDRQELLPSELRRSDVLMSLSLQQLQPGQRAAIRFYARDEGIAATAARIEVFGDGDAYKLLDSDGQPLEAEQDGSYLVGMSRGSGESPAPLLMAWLEALLAGQGSLLYVQPIELLRAAGSTPSIRSVAQPIELLELSTGPYLMASTDTLTEGGEAVQLDIVLPSAHVGLQFELKLALSGNAMLGMDYTLVAADPATVITFAGEATDEITLRVESAPAEPLGLLLRPRADDSISQGDQLLNLRVIRYQVVLASRDTAGGLFSALSVTIRDNDPLVAQQVQVGSNRDFVCVLLNGGTVRCAGSNTHGRATPPVGLGGVAQLALGAGHACALTVAGTVRCWGRNDTGQSTPPDDDLGPFVQLAVGNVHSCAVTVAGEVRCWGSNGFNNQATPPNNLGPVAQVGVGNSHSCALLAAGSLRCWGTNPESVPAGLFTQLAVANFHNCAVTVAGAVHCWGSDTSGRASPPNELGPDGALGAVAQVGVGEFHSCALTVAGEVHCWGSSSNDRATPPSNLGVVTQLTVGDAHSCARTVSGRLRCWGAFSFGSLPPGAVMARSKPSGVCALLADGSVSCLAFGELVPPPELAPSEVVMSVQPRQLQSGQRAAIRFIDLAGTAEAFTARIEIFGDGSADIGSYYRLLDSAGQPLVAGNSVQLSGNPPMAWLEALPAGRGSRLYVRPIELLPESGEAPSIRLVAQPIELLDGLFFIASTDTLTEGRAAAQLSIVLPTAHAGLQLELELELSGSALAGTDYTLVAAEPATMITFDGEANSTITVVTLRVESAPAVPLILLLRPRADDPISQIDRSLKLRISRYQAGPEGGETAATVDLPAALNLSIADDDPLVVQQIQAQRNGSFACILLSNGTVRCLLTNGNRQSAQPADLGAVTQLARGTGHSCALTVAGRVRCWGSYEINSVTQPPDLAGVVQLVGNYDHICALTAAGEVECWGRGGNGQASPPDDLGPVAQVGVGQFHSCALTVAGRVRCWGFDGQNRIDPPAGLVTQLSVGEDHSCAVTVAGEVKCWGGDIQGSTRPPDDLGPVVQVGVGDEHNCAVTVAGRVRCWGLSSNGRINPPGDLGVVTQLAVGWDHSCALTALGRLRCWGKLALGSLSRDPVMTVDASGRCALLADGSAACPMSSKFVPSELGPSEVAMAVLPRQLNPGQRAAIHFTVLGNVSGSLAARIEIFGDGAADVSSYYRLLDSAGTPLDSALVAGNSVRLMGNANSLPTVWLEAQPAGRGSRLYVRPSELLRESGEAVPIRMVAQPVELIDGLYFTASADALAEGGEEAQLSILLPLVHAGLRVELALAVDGTALAGSDYTLVAADPAQGIAFGGGANSTITLRIESAPAEALRLLLRPRGADSIGQGQRLLNLRISRYQVFPASTETVALPAALDFSIADDEPLTVQQLQLGPDGDFACVLLNGGSVSCVGDNTNDRATPPDDLGGVTQLAVGMGHSCAVTVAGTVRCWGANGSEQATPPVGLDQVVHVAVGGSHSCALTALGAVHCWGSNTFNQATPPDSLGPDGALGPVAEIGVGESHSCALTKGEDNTGAKSVKVRCWGLAGGNPDDSSEGGDTAAAANCTVAAGGAVTCLVAGKTEPSSLDETSGVGALGPVTQLAVGGSHSCVVTFHARALCWGDNTHGQALAPPDVQGQTEELGLGASHSCARTISGGVRCWGLNEDGQTSSTVGLGQGGALGPATQLEVGNNHGCARVESGRLYCWGDFATDISTLPPHVVTAVDAAGVCALLVDGSLYCPGNQELFPDELRQGDGVMSVLPRQLLFGERAAIRFANLRTDGAFTAQFEVFGDGTADVSSAYRLLDSDGQPLDVGEGGIYEIEGVSPMAWLESLVDGRSLFLYVRPLELLLNSGPELSIRQAVQRVELTTALARLRVSVPAGEFLLLPVQGTNTVTADVRVEAMDAMDMPVNSTGLLLVAEPIAGSVRYWFPSVAQPAVLSATGETGVFEGRLMVALDEDTTAASLRIGVIGFAQTQGIIIETAVVQVLQSLSFVAVASTTTEGADDVELQIGLPQGHVGRSVEIDLSIAGTALYDSDYTLVVPETSGGLTISDPADSVISLQLTDVPDTQLRLLLRPRANDAIGQGERRVELRISGYRVAGDDERSADALPTTLGVTILDPYLPVMQRLLDVASGAACVLLDEDNEDLLQLRCWTAVDAAAELSTVLAAEDILSARQLAFGEQHVCWLQQDRQVLCDGSDSSGRVTVPAELSTTATVSVVAGREGSCAVDENGALRCWGRNGDEQSALPADLSPVTQLSLGDGHGCALHAGGVVSCWGNDTNGQATPPDALDLVVQLALGYEHSCALQGDGQVRCWGGNMPPVDLGLATQLTSGANHSCALLKDGAVRCWGASDSGQLSVPSLPPSGVKSLVAGGNSSCALLAEGSVRCWGGGLESAVPAELQPGDVAVSVLPQRLLVGQRAAIRFADLRGGREAPAVRIELLDGTAKFGIDYRLLDAAGQPLSAAPDGCYLLAGDMQPAAYIESLPDTQGRALRTLHVLVLETVPAAGPAPSLRRAAQRVALVDPGAFVGRLVVQMHGGAEQLLTADKMTLIPLRLLLTDIDGRSLDEFTAITVRLEGMLSGDSMLVPAEPFEMTASGIGVTTEVMVILGDSGETTVHFTVLDKPLGAVVVLSPTVLRVTLLSEPLDLDVTDDGRVDTEDVILLIQFLNAGRGGILPPALVPWQQRLEDLRPLGVVDLRLDLDGDSIIDMTDLRIILRHLAGLRGAALGEGVEQEQVEAVLRPQPSP